MYFHGQLETMKCSIHETRLLCETKTAVDNIQFINGMIEYHKVTDSIIKYPHILFQ